MKKRFSDEQIIGFLREAEAGVSVQSLYREQGLSDASFCTWRSGFVFVANKDVAVRLIAFLLFKFSEGIGRCCSYLTSGLQLLAAVQVNR